MPFLDSGNWVRYFRDPRGSKSKYERRKSYIEVHRETKMTASCILPGQWFHRTGVCHEIQALDCNVLSTFFDRMFRKLGTGRKPHDGIGDVRIPGKTRQHQDL